LYLKFQILIGIRLLLKPFKLLEFWFQFSNLLSMRLLWLIHLICLFLCFQFIIFEFFLSFVKYAYNAVQQLIITPFLVSFPNNFFYIFFLPKTQTNLFIKIDKFFIQLLILLYFVIILVNESAYEFEITLFFVLSIIIYLIQVGFTIVNKLSKFLIIFFIFFEIIDQHFLNYFHYAFHALQLF
jgi:hypothetical protein